MPVIRASGSDVPVNPQYHGKQGGTVLNAGSIAGDTTAGPITSGVNMVDTATHAESDYGSLVKLNDGATHTTPPSTDRAGVQRARTDSQPGGHGTFAYYPDSRLADDNGGRNFIIRGAGGDSANRINNVANSRLRTPGLGSGVAVGRDNIHHNLNNNNRGTYTINVMAQPSININPARSISGSGVAANYVSASGTAGQPDGAANGLSRAVPGELTYHFGGKGKPTTDEYKARDSFEAADDGSS